MCLFIPIWIGVESHEDVKLWVEKQRKIQTIDMILAMYRQDYIEDIGNK